MDRDDGREEGVEFINQDDGSITARDLETGVAPFGKSKAEALAMLADALSLATGDGDPIEDEGEGEFLEELGIDPEEIAEAREETDDLPEFIQWEMRSALEPKRMCTIRLPAPP